MTMKHMVLQYLLIQLVLLTSDTVISFTHNADARDVISNDGSINFISLGFTERQKIKVSGASQSANNGVFTIYDVSTNELTLIKNDILTTEAAGSTVIQFKNYIQ